MTRDADLLARRQHAASYSEVAGQLGVSRERIRQRVVRLRRAGQPLPKWIDGPRVRGRTRYRDAAAMIALARTCASATEFAQNTGRSRIAWGCLEMSGRLPALRRLWRWRQAARRRRTRVWTAPCIIAVVQRFSRGHRGRMPRQQEFGSTPYLPSHPVVYRHFGSMGALADAAGLAWPTRSATRVGHQHGRAARVGRELGACGGYTVRVGRLRLGHVGQSRAAE